MLKKICKLSMTALLATFVLVACGKDDSGTGENSNQLQVITTFSILHDIVSTVGGDLVDVHSMVPIGTDPHEYEPLPEDIKKATDADVLFYNGLNLEGGEHGWFFKLIDSVGADEANIFELMKGVEPMYLTSEDGNDTEVNAHAFLDPVVGIQMTENARDALIQVDGANKEVYEENAEKLLEELRAVDQEYETKIGEIPEDKRILVTSERAYQYMAQRYGLKEGYIWEVDTDENGTPAQIKALVNFVKENDVPVLFVETNVDARPMETVSNETGVKIAPKIFSDELGMSGEKGDTLVKFLRHNIDTIYAGLMEE